METISLIRRGKAAALVSALSLMLAACLFLPGKFDSAMDVRKDGAFTFRYTGEIVLLPLAEPKREAGSAENAQIALDCFDDNGETRPCSAEEIAEQKKTFEENAAASSKSEAEMAKMFLGGLDPKDPKSAEEFAAKLRRQTGWRKVAYQGDGVFDVEFLVSGRLDRDFVFPTIEGFPMANAFVVASLRNDGTVRIDAPGYGATAAGMPMGAMMAASSDLGKSGSGPKLPERNGSFVLKTNGAVLANNTDEGPKPDAAGQLLSWKIDAGTTSPPTALIRLTP